MPYNFTIYAVNYELVVFFICDVGIVSFDKSYLLYCLFVVIVVVGSLLLLLLLLFKLFVLRLIKAECCDWMGLHAKCWFYLYFWSYFYKNSIFYYSLSMYFFFLYLAYFALNFAYFGFFSILLSDFYTLSSSILSYSSG